MSMKQLLEDVAASLAIGFAGRAAERLDPGLSDSPAHESARTLGSQIADALADSLAEGGSRDTSRESSESPPVVTRVQSNFSDEEIVAERMSVWNYKVPLTPELIRALNAYDILPALTHKGA